MDVAETKVRVSTPSMGGMGAGTPGSRSGHPTYAQARPVDNSAHSDVGIGRSVFAGHIESRTTSAPEPSICSVPDGESH
jgi:hypothetical protein